MPASTSEPLKPKAARAAEAELERTQKLAEKTSRVKAKRQEIHELERAFTDFETASRAREEAEDIAIEESHAAVLRDKFDSAVALRLKDERAGAELLISIIRTEDEWSLSTLGAPIDAVRHLQAAEKRLRIATSPDCELRLSVDDPHAFVSSLGVAGAVVAAARNGLAPTVMRSWADLEERIHVEANSGRAQDDLEFCRKRLAATAARTTVNRTNALLEQIDREQVAAQQAKQIARAESDRLALIAYRSGASDVLPPGHTSDSAIKPMGGLEPATRNGPQSLRRVLTQAEKAVVGMLTGVEQ